MKRVVYTCLFGRAGQLNDFEDERHDIDFICFTDASGVPLQFLEADGSAQANVEESAAGSLAACRRVPKAAAK